jgi:hypothetical protein
MGSKQPEQREKCTLTAREREIRVAATAVGLYRTSDLARAAGVTYPKLIRTMSGALRCGPRFAGRIAAALGKPIEELFTPAGRGA